MAITGYQEDDPGKAFSYFSIRRLLQKQCIFSFVAAASITWADVGLSTWSYIRRTEAHAFGKPQTDSEQIYSTQPVSSDLEEYRQTFAPATPAEKTLVADNSTFKPPPYDVASAPSPSTGQGHLNPSYTGHTHIFLNPSMRERILQAASDLFALRFDTLGASPEYEKHLPTKTGYAVAAATVAPDNALPLENSSTVLSGNFYGRFLQTVSDLIPRRLFSENREGEAEEDGFLSRRRPKRGRSAATASATPFEKTEAEAHDLSGQAPAAYTRTEFEAYAQKTTAAAAPAEPGALPVAAEYSLGGVREFGNRKPRRTPLSLPSPLPSYGGYQLSKRNDGSVPLSSSSTIKHVEEEQHYQQPSDAAPEAADEASQQHLLPRKHIDSASVSSGSTIEQDAEVRQYQQPTAAASEGGDDATRQHLLYISHIDDALMSSGSTIEQEEKGQPLRQPSPATSESANEVTQQQRPLSASDTTLLTARQSLKSSATAGNSSESAAEASNIESEASSGARPSETRSANDAGLIDAAQEWVTEAPPAPPTMDQENEWKFSQGAREPKDYGKENGQSSSNSGTRSNKDSVSDRQSSKNDTRTASNKVTAISELPWRVAADEKRNTFPEKKRRHMHVEQLTPQRIVVSEDEGVSREVPVSPAQHNSDDLHVNLSSTNSNDKGEGDSSNGRAAGREDTSSSSQRASHHGQATIQNSSSSTPPTGISSNTRSQQVPSDVPAPSNGVTTGRVDNDRETDSATPSSREAKQDTTVATGWARGLQPFNGLLSMPLSLLQILEGNTVDTPTQASHTSPTQHRKPTSSSSRNSSSRRNKQKPSVTLDTLREKGGLGSSFAQAVDAGGAVIEVLTASRDLQEALESLDLSAFGLPPAKSKGGKNSSRSSWDKLHSAVKAVEEVAHWSTSLDNAINAGKDLGVSISSNLRALNPSVTYPSYLFQEATAADGAEHYSAKKSKGDPHRRGQIKGVNIAGGDSGSKESDTATEERSPTADLKAAALAALTVAADKAEVLQTAARKALAQAESSDSNKGSITIVPQVLNALDVNNILIAIAGLNASERARSLQPQRRKEHQKDKQHNEEDQHEQPQGIWNETLLTRAAASVADPLGALLQLNTNGHVFHNDEYMMPLLRELYRLGRRLFETLDISISVADESMDAMQLNKLLHTYETLVEEGKLAAVGFRSPRVPKRIGQPKVSCANKGMTCCVPAAAAGPDWKRKQQEHLFLQNSTRQECRAVFVSRSSMLCASTPYRGSTCNITHTETAAMDKYSAVLPVPAFSAAALCECEISRRRNSEGLHTLEGNAEWTAGEIQANLIEKARAGWEYVKKVVSTGNNLTQILDNTLGTTEVELDRSVPTRQQQSWQQQGQKWQQHKQKRQQQQQQQLQEHLAEKAFDGLAEFMTKVLVNDQLLKMFNSENPAGATIPPISVSLHLPAKMKTLLPNIKFSGLLPSQKTGENGKSSNTD